MDKLSQHLNVYIQIMSYQYKKSSILYQLEQAIKKKVAEKPKIRDQYQKNNHFQSSLDKRKTQPQRQSMERLPSKQKQNSKPPKQQINNGMVSLFQNENLVQVHVNPDSKSSESKKLTNRKVDKLFSLINYALGSADKAMKYINFSNFEGEFAVKLFRSDKQNLMNQMRNLTVDDFMDPLSQRQDINNKLQIPGVIILQQENLKLKKQLAILQKQNQRNRNSHIPEQLESMLTLCELQIQKYRQSVYRIKGNEFLQKLSSIIKKEIKYESLMRRNSSSQSSGQYDSIFRSLVSQRNTLCRETAKKMYSDDQFMNEQEKINKIKQQKQELLREIEGCKKKLGEVIEVSNIKTQIENLERQKQKVKQELYQIVPIEHRKRIQLGSLSNISEIALIQTIRESIEQLKRNRQQHKKLQLQKDEVYQQIYEKSNKLIQKQRQYSQLMSENERKDIKVKNLQQQLLNLKQEIDLCNQTIEELQKQNSDIQNKLYEMENKVMAQNNQQFQEFQALLEQQREKCRRIQIEFEESATKWHIDKIKLQSDLKNKQQLNSVTIEKQRKQIEIYSKDIASLVEQKQQLQRKVEQYNESVGREQDLQAKVQALQRALSQAYSEAKAANENLVATKAECKEMAKNIQQKQLECFELDSKLEENEKQLQRQKQQSQRMKAVLKLKVEQIESSRRTIISLKQKIEDLERVSRQYQEKIELIEGQLESGQKQVTQVRLEIADKDRLINEYIEQIEQIKAKEAIAGDMKQQIMRLQEEINQLKENRDFQQQRESELSQRQKQVYQKQMGYQSRLEEFAERDQQLREKEYEVAKIKEETQLKQQHLQQLDDQLQKKSAHLSQRMAQYESESRKVQLQIQIQENERAKIRRKVQELQSKQRQLIEKAQNLEKDIFNKAGLILRLEKEVLEVSQKNKQIKQKNEQLEGKINQMKYHSSMTEKEMVAQMEELMRTRLQKKLIEQDVLSKEQECLKLADQWKRRNEDQQSQIQKYKINLQTKIDEIERAQKEKEAGQIEHSLVIERYKSEIEHYKAQIQAYENKIEGQEALIDKIDKEIKQKCEQLQGWKRQSYVQKQNLEEQLSNRVNEIEEIKREVREKNRIIEQQRKQAENLELSTLSLEGRLAQTLKQYEHFRQLMAKVQSQSSDISTELQQKHRKIEKLSSEKEQLESQNSALRQQLLDFKDKYEEAIMKVELAYISLQQTSNQKNSFLQKQEKYQKMIDQLTQNNRILNYWKNVQVMYQKQYCNLIKRILKATIDLDELGNVDQMNIRSLLEVGSQKVLEHRKRIRDQESNEKRQRRELYEEVNVEQYCQKDERKELLASNISMNNEEYKQVLGKQPKLISENSQNSLRDQVKNEQTIQKLEHKEIQQEKGEERREYKNLEEFNDFKDEQNQSMISQDQHNSKQLASNSHDGSLVIEDLDEVLNNEGVLNKRVSSNKEDQSLLQNQGNSIDNQGKGIQKKPNSPRFSEFNDDNSHSQLENSLMSQNIVDENIIADFQEKERGNTIQQDNMQEEASQQPRQQKIEQGYEYARETQQLRNQFQFFNEVDQVKGDESQLSHVSDQRKDEQQQQLQLHNFMNFNQQSVNESIMSNQQQVVPVKEGEKVNELNQINDINDFNDISSKMDSSLISQNPNQGQIQANNQFSETGKNDQEKEESSNLRYQQRQFSQFGDFVDQMNSSMISNIETKPHGQEQLKKIQQIDKILDSEDADYEQFGNFQEDVMNSSLMSDI